MENTYRRYRELTRKAKNALESKYGLGNDHLVNAVNELNYLREEEIPQHVRSGVEEILSSCRTTKPKGEEGIFQASIEAMSQDQQRELRKHILSL